MPKKRGTSSKAAQEFREIRGTTRRLLRQATELEEGAEGDIEEPSSKKLKLTPWWEVPPQREAPPPPSSEPKHEERKIEKEDENKQEEKEEPKEEIPELYGWEADFGVTDDEQV